MSEKICLVCVKRFSTRSRLAKYCGRDCYYQMKRIRGDRVNWTNEVRLRFSKRQMGVNNPSWRGGISKERLKSLNTIRYKRFKEQVFKRDNNQCRNCGSSESLTVDHIVRWSLDEAKRWDFNNVQTLCKECHIQKNVEEGRKYWINQFGKSQAYGNIKITYITEEIVEKTL